MSDDGAMGLLDALRHARAARGYARNKDSELDALRAKNADLEAQLMRLEVGGKPAAAESPELAVLREKNAELEARIAALGDLEARLKRLETAPAPTGSTAPTAPAAPATPAADKPGKPAAGGR
jgi:BMFP domain-containing protein YqiC